MTETAIKTLERRADDVQMEIGATDQDLTMHRAACTRAKALLKRLYNERDELATALAKLRGIEI